MVGLNVSGRWNQPGRSERSVFGSWARPGNPPGKIPKRPSDIFGFPSQPTQFVSISVARSIARSIARSDTYTYSSSNANTDTYTYANSVTYDLP
jgi:hypothetical protein